MRGRRFALGHLLLLAAHHGGRFGAAGQGEGLATEGQENTPHLQELIPERDSKASEAVTPNEPSADSLLEGFKPPHLDEAGVIWKPEAMDGMTPAQADKIVASANKKARKALQALHKLVGRRKKKAPLSELAEAHSYDDGFTKDYAKTAKEYVANSNLWKPLLDYSNKWAKWFAVAKKTEFNYFKAVAKEITNCFPKPIPTPTCPKDYYDRLCKWNSAITASHASKGEVAGMVTFMSSEGEVHEKLDKRPEDDVKLSNKRFKARWDAIKDANGNADEEKEPESVVPGGLAATDSKTMLNEAADESFEG